MNSTLIKPIVAPSLANAPCATVPYVEITLITTWFLNIADALLTILFIQLGLAVEANPLMEILIDQSPLVFMVAKLIIVSLGVFLLWRLRRFPMARVGSFLVGLTYVLLIVWHLNGVFRYIHSFI